MISIIIIVKNDRRIEDTLDSLMEIKKPEKTEIIVVDASKKETLLNIKKKFHQVRWFYYENKTSKKFTYSEQRNMGIRKSKGNIVVFLDSDCIPTKIWLVEITKLIREKRENVVAGLVKYNTNSHIGYQEQEKYLEECPTMNMAFNKRILKKVGYFDENLEAGEDIDFAWRLIDKGYKIKYNPKAIISHDWGTFKQDIKRAFRYGKARINLYKKHPNKINYLLNYNKDFFSIYSVLFFFYIISIIPVSAFFHWYLLLILIPFIKNIKNNPLRKMVFDFSFGFGVIKKLFEVTFLNK